MSTTRTQTTSRANRQVSRHQPPAQTINVKISAAFVAPREYSVVVVVVVVVIVVVIVVVVSSIVIRAHVRRQTNVDWRVANTTLAINCERYVSRTTRFAAMLPVEVEQLCFVFVFRRHNKIYIITTKRSLFVRSFACVCLCVSEPARVQRDANRLRAVQR